MIGTIAVRGTDGKVMAPIGKGCFVQGKRADVLITAMSDEDLPLEVRQALVGLVVSTVFDAAQIYGAAPPGSRVAYASEVAEALVAVQKGVLATKFLAVFNELDPGSEYHFLAFKAGEYRLLG